LNEWNWEVIKILWVPIIEFFLVGITSRVSYITYVIITKLVISFWRENMIYGKGLESFLLRAIWANQEDVYLFSSTSKGVNPPKNICIAQWWVLMTLLHGILLVQNSEELSLFYANSPPPSNPKLKLEYINTRGQSHLSKQLAKQKIKQEWIWN